MDRSHWGRISKREAKGDHRKSSCSTGLAGPGQSRHSFQKTNSKREEILVEKLPNFWCDFGTSKFPVFPQLIIGWNLVRIQWDPIALVPIDLVLPRPSHPPQDWPGKAGSESHLATHHSSSRRPVSVWKCQSQAWANPRRDSALCKANSNSDSTAYFGDSSSGKPTAFYEEREVPQIWSFL